MLAVTSPSRASSLPQFFFSGWLRPVRLDLLVAPLQFLTDLPALLGLFVAAFFFAVLRLQGRHGRGPTLVIHRNHGEEATVGVTHRAFANIFGHDFDADFH